MPAKETPFLQELAQECAQYWHDTKLVEEKEKRELPAKLEQTWENMKPRLKANSKKGLSSFATYFYMSDYNLQAYSPSMQDVIDMLPWELKVWHDQGILTLGTAEGNPKMRSIPLMFNYGDAAQSRAIEMERAAKRCKHEVKEE